MARTVLKERVFAPVGRSLGTFSALDLETFDIEYTDSDEKQEGDGSSDSTSNKSSVPDPKDDNVLEPEDNDEKDIPDTWDINGEDLDDEEPSYDDNSEPSYGSSGDSGDSSSSSGGSSDGSDEDDLGSDDPSDKEDTTDGEDMRDTSSSGSSSEEDFDSGEDFDTMSGENSGDSDGSFNSGNSSDSGSGSSDENSGGESQDISYDEDWDSGEGAGSNGGWEASELESAIDTIESSDSESSKKRRESEDRMEREQQEERRDNPMSMGNVDPEEAKAARDMLGKAIKDSREAKRNSDSLDKNVAEDLENAILGAMGAGSLTTMFNPNNAADWKMQLDRILDTALGFDIITNPNLVNKKIEDAPPGREDEIPEIKDIAILLDCSGSMGAAEFKQVIQHMDTMFQVRKMDKVNFHIIDWGSSNVREVLSHYSKVKGRNFRREIMTHGESSWPTCLTPAFLVASQKIHKPDAILILTDAELHDSLRSDGNGKIAAEYIKKHRKKIIWVLTKGSYSSQKRGIEGFDPTAIKMNRVIKFK